MDAAYQRRRSCIIIFATLVLPKATYVAISKIRGAACLKERDPRQRPGQSPPLSASIDSILQEMMSMPVITIRNLREATHRALKLRAVLHGRSTEAEVRQILEDAIRPDARLKIGSELAALGQRVGGVELDVTRDPAPPEAAQFE